MPERLLRLRETARLFRDHTRKGVPRLVYVYLPDAGLAGVALESARIIFLKNLFAAETSRFALSMNSIVWPAESTAR